MKWTQILVVVTTTTSQLMILLWSGCRFWWWQQVKSVAVTVRRIKENILTLSCSTWGSAMEWWHFIPPCLFTNDVIHMREDTYCLCDPTNTIKWWTVDETDNIKKSMIKDYDKNNRKCSRRGWQIRKIYILFKTTEREVEGTNPDQVDVNSMWTEIWRCDVQC